MIGPDELEWALDTIDDMVETYPYVSRLGDPFRSLVGTLISARTRDEATREAAERLFREVDGPRDLLKLEEDRLAELIKPVGFYNQKARYLRETARLLLEEHGGRVPDTMGELLELPGVGRKTANLVLITAFDKQAISVDTHVHRITNRWGLVETSKPEETEMALRDKVPRRLWKKVNAYIVPFGKQVCTPLSPHCSTCPLMEKCPQRGVERHR